MTKIKICGLTSMEDVKWANELLPDYIGFIFAESKRKLSAEKAGMIAYELNPKIKKAGVFVNPTMEYINTIMSICPLDILQLHGDETPEFCSEIDYPVWKAFRMQTKKTLSMIKRYNVDAILLDGYHPNTHGGMGVGFPWKWAEDINIKEIPLVIAGGLNENNVEHVIKLLHPAVVDVSSFVEINGFKDRDLVECFIRKVREIDV